MDDMLKQLYLLNESYMKKVILLRDFINEDVFFYTFGNIIKKSELLIKKCRKPMHEVKYYIVAPAFLKSGGPELLHQLANTLTNQEKDVYVAYIGCEGKVPSECIPEGYLKYVGKNIIRAEEIPDDSSNVIIVPETYCNLLNKFDEAYIYLWWLSVDFMFWNIAPESIGYIYSQVDMHLYQSYYAKEFLEKLEIPSTRMLSLSDYINDLYIQQDDTRFASEKKDIVAYNPAKGRLFTQKIIRKMPETKFVAIQNMTNTEVFELLKKSKVYIDFGNHPGKDRIPREAAMLGCCIITGRRGAAGNDIDVCIPDKYKFDESKCDIADICEQIQECMDNYEDNISDFEEYRKKIRAEKSLFEEQVKEIFK